MGNGHELRSIAALREALSEPNVKGALGRTVAARGTDGDKNLLSNGLGKRQANGANVRCWTSQNPVTGL